MLRFFNHSLKKSPVMMPLLLARYFSNIKPEDINVTMPKGGYKYVKIDNIMDSNIHSCLIEEFQNQGFTSLTSIQSHCIPMALDGKDLVGIAKTGSGKTLAFTIPAVSKLLTEVSIIVNQGPVKRGKRNPRVLILAPTRELAMQICEANRPFCKASRLTGLMLYGGQRKDYQIEPLSRGVDILYATPGRLLDLENEGYVDLSEIQYLVLDEADRMLDMGFIPQIEEIISKLTHPNRQSILLTATWPKQIQDLCYKVCKDDAIILRIGSEGDHHSVNEDIHQHIDVLQTGDDKLAKLTAVLDEEKISKTSKVLIFAQQKRRCDYVASHLSMKGFSCDALHGDKTQFLRTRIMNNFKSGQTNILVATDVASRGIDVKDISLVINLDFPQSIEDYIHRIGRTGRAGNKGRARTFFAEEDSWATKSLIGVLTRSNQEIPAELHKKNTLNKFMKPSFKKSFRSNRGEERGGPRAFNDRYRNKDTGRVYNDMKKSFGNDRELRSPKKYHSLDMFDQFDDK